MTLLLFSKNANTYRKIRHNLILSYSFIIVSILRFLYYGVYFHYHLLHFDLNFFSTYFLSNTRFEIQLMLEIFSCFLPFEFLPFRFYHFIFNHCCSHNIYVSTSYLPDFVFMKAFLLIAFHNAIR